MPFTSAVAEAAAEVNLWPLRLGAWAPERLVQRVVDGGKGRLQLGAKTRNGGDDRHRDAGGNQAVFDGGGTAFVTKEASNEGHDSDLLTELRRRFPTRQ